MDLEKRYKISEVAELLGVKDYYVRNLETYIGLKYPIDESGVKFLTDRELDLIKDVLRLKEEKGWSYKAIHKHFIQEGILEENENNSLEMTTLDQMTPVDLEKTMSKMFMHLVVEREKEMIDTLKKFIIEDRRKIKEELSSEVKQGFESIETFSEPIQDLQKSYKNLSTENKELKDLLSNYINQNNMLKENLEQERQKIAISAAEKVHEQYASENKKLLTAIEKMRDQETKPWWKRMFSK